MFAIFQFVVVFDSHNVCSLCSLSKSCDVIHETHHHKRLASIWIFIVTVCERVEIIGVRVGTTGMQSASQCIAVIVAATLSMINYVAAHAAGAALEQAQLA